MLTDAHTHSPKRENASCTGSVQTVAEAKSKCYVIGKNVAALRIPILFTFVGQ